MVGIFFGVLLGIVIMYVIAWHGIVKFNNYVGKDESDK